MDRLSHGDRRALQAASVIGQRFGGDVLGHLIQDPGYDCRGLVEHGLARVEGTDFLFAHALIQESVYSSLLKQRRKALHRGAAEWFCERDAVLYAEHLDRAGEDTAPEAYLEAARQQATRYELEQAGRLVQRGIELVGDPETEWDLAWLKGEILREVGALDKSLDAYRRALGVADDPARGCRARIGLAHNMRLLERYEEALELLDKAEVSAGSQIVAEERPQIHYHRASIQFRLVNPQKCLEQGELALEYALQCRSPEHVARALSVLGDACYMRGRMITAHNHFRQCVELAREHGFLRIEAANLHMQGLTRYFQNDVRTALKDALAGAEGAVEIGQYRSEMLARGIMGGILLDMGDMEASEQQFDHALVLARTYGARSYEPFSLVGLAKILASKGDRSGAMDLVEEAISISREVGMRTSGPRALGALGLITEDSETRRRALFEGEEILREGSLSHHYLSFYRDAMETSLDIGDWASVERYGSALKEYTRPEPLPLSDFFIARGFTLASFHKGQTDTATIEKLRNLCEEAERVGLKCALPAIQASLLSIV
jgi:tetratricopeptide (TPR) repeat protein